MPPLPTVHVQRRRSPPLRAAAVHCLEGSCLIAPIQLQTSLISCRLSQTCNSLASMDGRDCDLFGLMTLNGMQHAVVHGPPGGSCPSLLESCPPPAIQCFSPLLHLHYHGLPPVRLSCLGNASLPQLCTSAAGGVQRGVCSGGCAAGVCVQQGVCSIAWGDALQHHTFNVPTKLLQQPDRG